MKHLAKSGDMRIKLINENPVWGLWLFLQILSQQKFCLPKQRDVVLLYSQKMDLCQKACPKSSHFCVSYSNHQSKKHRNHYSLNLFASECLATPESPSTNTVYFLWVNILRGF